MAPLHPATVHFPIVLLPTALVLDWAARWWKKPDIALASLFLLSAGVAFLWIAVLTGQLEYTAAEATLSNGKGLPVLVLHSRLGYLLSVVWSGLLLGRLALLKRSNSRLFLLYFVLSAMACWILFLNAYLGGVLVYQHGAGIRR
ncbi:MAG: DUF2231 domain-containing protein [Armatimonadetes bacterium]|nr:DUF2231 domain-containing protein [Armatimonadota bacterium]MDW8121327.1 DUF2231 domain-containing protein [Armatimonadota bacterium]